MEFKRRAIVIRIRSIPPTPSMRSVDVVPEVSGRSMPKRAFVPTR